MIKNKRGYIPVILLVVSLLFLLSSDTCHSKSVKFLVAVLGQGEGPINPEEVVNGWFFASRIYHYPNDKNASYVWMNNPDKDAEIRMIELNLFPIPGSKEKVPSFYLIGYMYYVGTISYIYVANQEKNGYFRYIPLVKKSGFKI